MRCRGLKQKDVTMQIKVAFGNFLDYNILMFELKGDGRRGCLSLSDQKKDVTAEGKC